MNNQKIPQLVAHRGYKERYPENSWLGLKAALDAGACWLEFDVQMCADGRFILMHDSALTRTAAIRGSIFDLGTEELEAISVHEPARFGNEFYPLPVSNLEDVLPNLSEYPQSKYMVEIKEESLDHWGMAVVMDRLLDILRPYSKNSVVISFSHTAIQYAKNSSDMKIGLVLDKYDQKHKEYAVGLNPEYLICNHKKLPKGQKPWPGPWEWMLYEINTPQQALEWGIQGIRYIETADIGAMLMDQRLSTKDCRHGV